MPDNLENIREAREAARMAAETTVVALERLQEQEALVQAARHWRKAFEGQVHNLIGASETLRNAVDAYEEIVARRS